MKTVTCLAAAAMLTTGCNIGAKYTIGGTLTGLMGQGLVLQDNSGNDLGLASNGAFVFSDGIKNGDAYSVTVKTQPAGPSQTCTVHNGSGNVDRADVTHVLVSCTEGGRFAYVANQLSNDLSAYSIDSATGALTPIAGSPFAASGTAPAALAVDPNGSFLYVVNNGSDNVSAYSIAAGGTLSAAGVPVSTGSAPDAVAVDPADHYVYVANFAANSVSAYSIDEATGSLTELPNSPFLVGAQPTSLKFDPNGNFLYVTGFGGGNVTVLALDPATGSLSAVSGSPFGAGAGAVSIAIDPSGAFAYVADVTAHTLSEYSINTSTGALTALSGSPLATTSSPESARRRSGRPLCLRRECDRRRIPLRRMPSRRAPEP